MKEARQPAVVGASIAGALTALRLADAGIPCTVFEARREPWAKVCGEGLHPSGLRAVEEVVGDVRHLGTPLRGFRFTDEHGELIALEHHDSDDGLGCDRLLLERRLWNALTRHARIDFHRGVAVVGAGRDEAGWVLETPSGSRAASHVVAADGVRSRMRSFAGRNRGERHGRWGVRQRLRIAGRLPSAVEICFLEDCEVFVTPLGDDRISIAALAGETRIRELRDPRALAACLRRLPGFAGLEAEPEEAPQVLPHCGQHARAWCREGLYLVGDAAAFLDPISGSGMTLAALSARTVADALESVWHQGVVEPVAERRAARALRRQVRPFRNLTRFLRALGQSPRFRGAALAVLRRSPALVRVLARPTAAPALPGASPRAGSSAYQMFS